MEEKKIENLTKEVENLNIKKDESKVKVKDVKHAIVVSQTWCPEDYEKYVDEKILNIKFKPDLFQKQSFYFLSRECPIFVSAHTSSGKTLVAEYAISLSNSRNSRTIYTSPIKALSNQKYYDFKQKYDDVGIVTGDVQVNPQAKCLIMTTEILRNLVYRNSDILRDTEFVIFDEVHYINDPERGVVWEECIIMLPPHITLVLLSATIPNSLEFSEWVGRTKNKTVYIISTNKRAVPLEHVIYQDWDVYEIDGCRNARTVPKTTKKTTNLKLNLVPYSKKPKPMGRFRIVDLANFIFKARLTPSIFFCFSKRRCEEYASILSSLNFNTQEESQKVKKFIDTALLNLSHEDRNLPQILSMSAMVHCGLAVHHGSLLPFVKECVEMLFSMNLIKILIATETFAMGVNMPAKCCVFLSLSKIDNGTFRYLSPGEYTQMSGRAGRRGMDSIGTVIIADPRLPNISVIRKIIDGNALSLSSQFKLSFGLILISIRSNVLVEDLMRKSYKEHGSQKNYNKDMVKLETLEKVNHTKCAVCGDLTPYLNSIERICTENWPIIQNSSILKKGVEILLKDNTVGVVESIEKPFIYLTHEKVIRSEDDKDCPKRFLLKSFDTRTKSLRSKVKFDMIFCILKDGLPTLDYETTDVMDLIKIKTLEPAFNVLIDTPSKACKNFEEDYENALKTRMMEEEINNIKIKYCASSLRMMDEYTQRIKFLEKREYIKEGSITLKGRAAAEIRTVNEILAIEMIFDNEFKETTNKALISMFSSMICEEKIDQDDDESLDFEKDSNKELNDGIFRMEYYFENLSKDLDDFFIPPFEKLEFSMAKAVYEWCEGSSLGTIVTKFKATEGGFVRLILRLEECCKEFINVCAIIGNKELEEKFKEASTLMKRDIVFLPSLYL